MINSRSNLQRVYYRDIVLANRPQPIKFSGQKTESLLDISPKLRVVRGPQGPPFSSATGSWKLGKASTGVCVIVILTLSNACWASGDHWKVFLLSKELSGLVSKPYPLINLL